MYKETTEGNGQVKIGVYICHCGVIFFLVLKMSKKLIISILAFSILSFSQENMDSRDSTKKQISLPCFDLHIGAGTINGARLGLRTHFNEHFSIETSFGIPTTHFIGGGEREERYSLGINWHKTLPKGLMVSLICANLVQPNRSYPSIPNNKFLNYLRISLNIGYLSTIGSNFTFFIRGGMGVSFVEDFRVKGHKVGFTANYLDLGLGKCFDFK